MISLSVIFHVLPPSSKHIYLLSLAVLLVSMMYVSDLIARCSGISFSLRDMVFKDSRHNVSFKSPYGMKICFCINGKL